MSDDINPSSASEARVPQPAARRRVPMSVPTQKLRAPVISGYHTYWALESRAGRFLEAGYEFVEQNETVINNHNPANDRTKTGNMALDSRIRVPAGVSETGEPEFHVLMKIRREWYNEDRRVIEDRNAAILANIFRNEQILGSESVSPEDREQRYVKTAELSLATGEPMNRNGPLFKRPTRKAKL